MQDKPHTNGVHLAPSAEDIHLSFYEKSGNIKPTETISVAQVFERIRSKDYRPAVHAYQSTPAFLQKRERKKLACFTPNGVFETRQESGLLTYSNLMCFEFRALPIEQLTALTARLKADKYIYGFARAANEYDLNVIIAHDAPADKHATAFDAIAWYFLKEFADFRNYLATQDANRRLEYDCLISHDASAWLNPQANVFTINNSTLTPMETIHTPANGSPKPIMEGFKHDANGKQKEVKTDATTATPAQPAPAPAKKPSPPMLLDDYKPKAKSRIAVTPDAITAELLGDFDALKRIQDISEADVLEACYNGENGLAELCKRIFKGRFISDNLANEWLRVERGVWIPDDEKAMLDLVHTTLIDIIKRHFDNAQNQIGKNAGKELDEDSSLEKKRKAYKKALDSLTKNVTLTNVIKLLSNKLNTSTKQFDKYPYLINLKDGVYDLENHTFRNHKDSDLFKRQADIYYKPTAKCENWLAFLNKIFASDAELIRFVRAWIGLCLTGSFNFQGFIYSYGKGANGKTIFYNTLEKMLGSYCTSLPIDLLLIKNANATDAYQKVRLHGARLVVLSEVPQGRRLNESEIKDLTGGEKIHARQPFGRPFSFEPTHKLSLMGNHKLIINGTDYAIWRRVHLVPFKVTIPPNERIAPEKLLAMHIKELDGIFQWALEGLKDYQTHGFIVPECVKKATAEYQSESDSLAPFFEACLEDGNANYSVTLKELWDAYVTFCTENKEVQMFKTKRSFAAEIENRDYLKRTNDRNRPYFDGLRLKPFYND